MKIKTHHRGHRVSLSIVIPLPSVILNGVKDLNALRSLHQVDVLRFFGQSSQQLVFAMLRMTIKKKEKLSGTPCYSVVK